MIGHAPACSCVLNSWRKQHWVPHHEIQLYDQGPSKPRIKSARSSYGGPVRGREPHTEVTGSQDIDQRVDVGLGGEVDTGADMAQGGVDVLRVGRAQAV